MSDRTELVAKNTDRLLHRDEGFSIYLTEGDGIGIEVAGYHMVRPAKGWHEAATVIERDSRSSEGDERQAFEAWARDQIQRSRRMSEERGLSRLFVAITEWAGRRGAESINRLPGCWEGDLQFDGMPARVAINGHSEERRSALGPIPGFSAVVEINGWPAVLCHPYGGCLMGAKPGDEDRLIQTFEAEE